MLKQTLVWTALPHRSGGPLAPGTTLRLSVLLSPRLWSTGPAVAEMPLDAFPDFLDLPAAIAGAAFTVEFSGGPTLAATPVDVRLDSGVWKSLFRASTRVVPFRFEDWTGVRVRTFSVPGVHDLINGVYVRIFRDHGDVLPLNEVLAKDPGLTAIARDTPPRKKLDLTVPTVPVDLGGNLVQPKEPERPEVQGCMGCLLLPLHLLRRLVKWLAKLLGLSSSTPSSPASPLGGGGGGGSGGGSGGGGATSGTDAGATAAEAGGSGSGGTGSGAAGSGGAVPAGTAKDPASVPFDDLDAVLEPTSQTPRALPGKDELGERYDFHGMVAALGDYPELMRHAGLVVDLEVTLGDQLPAPTGTVLVRVDVPLQGDPKPEPGREPALVTVHYHPRTHYELGGGFFVARPRPAAPEIDRGLLRLDDPALFGVYTVDLPGAATKLRNAATNLKAEIDLKDRPANAPAECGLPTLQTAGISVVRKGAGEALREQFLRSWALNAALAAQDGSPSPKPAGVQDAPEPAGEYFAEDLVRGYRPDVWDDRSKSWRSLCRRRGVYRLLEPAEGTPGALERTDEGFVQTSVTEPLEPEPLRTVRTHESLFTWDGWSLCAPRPGLVILPVPDASGAEHGETANPARTPFRMETEFFPVPGSLPRLRIGWSYRLRVRVADLAGNSVFDPGSDAFAHTPPQATPQAPFGRYEPVEPPTVVLRAAPKEGESLERLTVRSAALDAPASIREQATERHLAPPSAAQRMVELYGLLDGPQEMRKDDTGWALAAREAASPTHGLHPGKDERVPLPGVEQVQGASARPADAAVYWVQKGEVKVVYLPDPPAAGVVLLGLPGDPGPRRIPWGGSWPDLGPLRLRVRGIGEKEVPAAPAWDEAARVLTVELRQGETARVRFGSYLRAGEADRMALIQWVRDAVPPAGVAGLLDQVQQGRNWLLLPYRELVLVHAVKQPLKVPKITPLSVKPERALGETAVSLDGTLEVDAKSTGKVDLWAEWSDRRDDPSDPANDPAQDRAARRMHLRELVLPDPADDTPGFQEVLDAMRDTTGVRHALGDTRYHRVRYAAVGTSRFREHFPPETVAEELVRPRPGEEAAPYTLEIPNAARPTAPRPLYAVPTFRWMEEETGPLARVRTRGCGGVRVYLERPWFSSGDGELLGVVLRPEHVPVDSAQAALLKGYTSEWGMDPLWHGAGTGPLAAGHFAGPVKTSGLSLEEVPGAAVDVVGFEPGYDAGRGLWYADVLLQAGAAYFPFARLALARFHPVSVEGAHLSRVVLSDFVQVVPERKATYQVVPDPGGHALVHVRLEGPGTFDAHDTLERGTVALARLEHRRHGDAGTDALGWEAVATVPLAPTPETEHSLHRVWEGTLRVPDPLPSPLRVVVLEAEVQPADPRTVGDPLLLSGVFLGEAASGGASAGDGPDAFAPVETEEGPSLGYRIVFADAAVFA